MNRARVLAHARWEFRLLIRNGEQLLLMFIIPLALLIGLKVTGRGTIDAIVPTIITVSLMATCFTSLAIGTGFERRSGALRYAATTPLTRIDLLLGKFLATAMLAIISIVIVCLAGLLLGWRPAASWPAALPIAILGAAAFAAWAVLLAGILRAEAVLALANGIFIVLLIFGGVLIPTSSMPGALGTAVSVLPSAALANGLTGTLADGTMPWGAAVILIVWALVGTLIARRRFNWD